MATARSVIVFDVNETLSDMSPLAARFAAVGAPADLAALWFATLLRDGFALTASGDNGSFSSIGTDALRRLLTTVELDRTREAAVEHIMAGMTSLRLHRDVREGVLALAAVGFRLVTLSNGPAEIAETLLGSAGIRDQFEALLSVENAAAWKPAQAAYDYAAAAMGTDPGAMVLVAVHPWDIHGASRAGLRTAWLNRAGELYPEYFEAPDFTVTALTQLPDALTAG